MRRFFALLTFCCLVASSSSSVWAEETSEVINPFNDPVNRNRGVSANVSDEPEPAAEQRTGFSFPKLSLPKLPKPTFPKLTMPKLQLPKLTMPQWAKRDSTPNTGPSTLQKLNTGTKNMLAKTRDTLMPWTVKDERPAARNVTGNRSSIGFSRTRAASNRSSASRNSESTSEKKSFLATFLQPADPPTRRIESPSDFLSQDRPHFDQE